MPPSKGDINATIDASLPYLHRHQLDFESGRAFELEVAIWAGSAGTINLTGATKASPFNFAITPAASGSEEDFIFRVPDIPIFMSFQTTDSTHLPGGTWAQVFLRVDGVRILRLAAGWISPEQALSYPAISGGEQRPGGGIINFQSYSNPAAGANLNVTVSSTKLIRPMAILLDLTTSSTVANRRVHIAIERTTGLVIWRGFFDTDQTASLTWTYVFSPIGFATDTLDTLFALAPLPSDLYIKPGWKLKTYVTNLQAGDQIANPSISSEEWVGDF